MAAFFLVLFGLGMFVVCAVSGVWNLLGAVRQRPDRGEAVKRGLAKVAAATALVAVPWLAAPTAESSTGWVDTDNDGMLDGFVNGSYDWVDINGGAWATVAGVLVLVILGALAFALAAIRAAGSRAPSRGSVRVGA